MSNVVPLFKEWLEIHQGYFEGETEPTWFLHWFDGGFEVIVSDTKSEAEVLAEAHEWGLPLRRVA